MVITTPAKYTYRYSYLFPLTKCPSAAVTLMEVNDNRQHKLMFKKLYSEFSNTMNA